MIGLWCLLDIIDTLREDETKDVKLVMIDVKALVYSYLFLFIVRVLIVLAIILSKIWPITLLISYVSFSIGSYNRANKWLNDVSEYENRTTLYDLKEKLWPSEELDED